MRKRLAVLMRLRRLAVQRSTAARDLEALFGAAVSVRTIEASAVTRILEQVEPGAAVDARQRVYRAFLRSCLVDHRLSEEELADLEHLRRVLGLDEHAIGLIHRRVAREVYSRSVAEVLADGRIDEEERRFLLELRERLEIPEGVADNIVEMKSRQRRAREEFPRPRGPG